VRDYATVNFRFWTGETGRQIRKLGPDVQVVALYLMTCPSSNMIGLYYLPLPTLAHETGIPFEGALKAIRSLIEVGFVKYDEDNDLVWVVRMAHFQIGERLKPTDKQCKGIQKQLDEHVKSCFYSEFLEVYGSAFSLNVSPSEAPSEPLARVKQAPPKPESSEQRAVSREKKANTTPPTHPEGWASETKIEIGAFLEAMRMILKPRSGDADDLHDQVENYFRKAQWLVRREYPVPDRGDGRPGRVDLFCEKGEQRVAIELDAVSPRHKSYAKLRGQAGVTTVIVLRNAVDVPQVAEIDHVVAMGWKTRSGNEPAARPVQKAYGTKRIDATVGVYRPEKPNTPNAMANAFLDHLYEDWDEDRSEWDRCFALASVDSVESAEGRDTDFVIILGSSKPRDLQDGLTKYKAKVSSAMKKAFGCEVQLVPRMEAA
jgi:hypothetical protein